MAIVNMRKTNKRLVLLLIFFVFLLLILLSFQMAPQFLNRKEKAFSQIKKEIINEMIIFDKGKKTTLKKINNQWYINQFPADQERIEKIIETVINLEKKEIVSKNKKKYKDFEVDGERKIELNNHTLYLGKNYSFQKSYFRVDKDEAVYLAQEDFSNWFYPEDFRDLKIKLINNEEKVSKLFLAWDDKELVLKKDKDQWFFDKGKKAKKDRVDFLINEIKTLKGDDILEKEKIDLSSYFIGLKIKLNEEKKEKKVGFYQRDREKYFFYQEGDVFVYQVPAAYVSSLRKEESDLIE